MNITNEDRIDFYKAIQDKSEKKIKSLHLEIKKEKTELLNQQQNYIKMLSNSFPLRSFVGKNYHHIIRKVFEESDTINKEILSLANIANRFHEFTPHGLENGLFLNDEFSVDVFEKGKKYVVYATYSEIYNEENYKKERSLILLETPLNQRVISECIVLIVD